MNKNNVIITFTLVVMAMTLIGQGMALRKITHERKAISISVEGGYPVLLNCDPFNPLIDDQLHCVTDEEVD